MMEISFNKKLRNFLKISFSSFILRILGVFFGYLSMLLITNTFGVREFGILSLCITIVSIFSLISRVGLDTSLIRIMGELFTSNNYKEILTISQQSLLFILITSIVSSIFLYWFSEYIASLILNKPYLKYPIQLSSIVIVCMSFTFIISTFFQAIQKYKEFLILKLFLNPFLFFCLLMLNNIFSFYIGKHSIIVLYVVGYFFTFLFALILYFFNFKVTITNNIKYKNKKTNKKYNFYRIINMSKSMFISNSIGLIIGWSSIIFLGIFRTEREVGIFSVVQRLASILNFVLFSINSIIAPKLVEYYTQNKFKLLKEIVKQTNKLIFFFSLPILLLYMIFPNFVLNFFGNDFQEGAYILVIVSIGQFINSMSGSVGLLLQMTDNQNLHRNVMLIVLFFSILFNLILIPIWGIKGAAIVNMFITILWNIIFVLLIKKKFGFWTIYFPKLNFLKK